MKATISKDGVVRTELNIKHRLSLDELMFVWIVANNVHYDSQVLLGLAKTRTKTKILHEVRNTLLFKDKLQAEYDVHEYCSEKQIDRMRSIFAVKFPELLPTEHQKQAIKKFNLKATGGAE